MSTAPDSTGGLEFEFTGDGQRPVLALHGLGGERTQPLALLDHHVQASTRILAPDLRGHGHTQLACTADTMNFPQMAADTEQLLHAVNLAAEPVTVIGISMGAAVAAELLARGNIAMRAVVFIRPAWGWQPRPENLAVFSTIAHLLDAQGATQGARSFRDTQDYASISAVSEPAASALLGQFTAPDAVRRVQRLIALPGSAPARPASAAVRAVSTMVIGREHDPVHPLALARQLSHDLGTPLEVVAPRYDQPETHAQVVTTMLRRFLWET